MKVRAEQFAVDLSKVDWSKVPASMKQDGEQLKAVAPFYAEGGDFKAGIDNYVAALNAQLSRAKPKAEKKGKEKRTDFPLPKKLIVLDEFQLKNTLSGPNKGAKFILCKRPSEHTAGEYWYPIYTLHADGELIWIAQSFEEKRAKELFEEEKQKYQPNVIGDKPKAAKKATGSKSGRHQSKAEAATAREAYSADKRKAEAGEFAKMSRNEVLEIAQRVHKNRRLAAQVVDEAVDHKKRLTPTPENLVRWMKEPGKYDLIGIDTFEKNNPTADLKIKKEIFWARLLKK